MSTHTLQQQIDAVAREIGMRERVYPTWVAKKKMKPEKADYEIAAMKAVLATLVGLQAVDPNHKPDSAAPALTKLERKMMRHAAQFVLAGEWPFEPEKSREREALESASDKIIARPPRRELPPMPELQCACTLRERDSGHRTDCTIPQLREYIDALRAAGGGDE